MVIWVLMGVVNTLLYSHLQLVIMRFRVTETEECNFNLIRAVVGLNKARRVSGGFTLPNGAVRCLTTSRGRDRGVGRLVFEEGIRKRIGQSHPSKPTISNITVVQNIT